MVPHPRSPSLVSQILRNLRGSMTAATLSRRLGLSASRFNRLEREEIQMGWDEFLEVMRKMGRDPLAPLHTHLALPVGAEEGKDILKCLVGARPLSEIAARTEIPRSTLSRALGGKAKVTLQQVVRIMTETNHDAHAVLQEWCETPMPTQTAARLGLSGKEVRSLLVAPPKKAPCPPAQAALLSTLTVLEVPSGSSLSERLAEHLPLPRAEIQDMLRSLNLEENAEPEPLRRLAQERLQKEPQGSRKQTLWWSQKLLDFSQGLKEAPQGTLFGFATEALSRKNFHIVRELYRDFLQRVNSLQAKAVPAADAHTALFIWSFLALEERRESVPLASSDEARNKALSLIPGGSQQVARSVARELLDLLKAEVAVAELAQATGVPTGRWERWLDGAAPLPWIHFPTLLRRARPNLSSSFSFLLKDKKNWEDYGDFLSLLFLGKPHGAVAERLGVSPSLVSRWAGGKVSPHLHDVVGALLEFSHSGTAILQEWAHPQSLPTLLENDHLKKTADKVESTSLILSQMPESLALDGCLAAAEHFGVPFAQLPGWLERRLPFTPQKIEFCLRLFRELGRVVPKDDGGFSIPRAIVLMQNDFAGTLRGYRYWLAESVRRQKDPYAPAGNDLMTHITFSGSRELLNDFRGICIEFYSAVLSAINTDQPRDIPCLWTLGTTPLPEMVRILNGEKH